VKRIGKLVIIPCGRRKKSVPAPAGQMYLGPYFRSCLKTALALTSKERVRVLSGKYGLLRLDQVISPYDQRIDKRGAITLPEIIRQATAQRIIGATDVTVLAGQAYSNIILEIWPKAAAPLYGIPGMGRHLAKLKQLRGERQ
jgi:hypothetical protein